MLDRAYAYPTLQALTSHCLRNGPLLSHFAGEGLSVARAAKSQPLSLWERRGPRPQGVGGEGLMLRTRDTRRARLAKRYPPPCNSWRRSPVGIGYA